MKNLDETIYEDEKSLEFARSNRLIEAHNSNTLKQNKILAFSMANAHMTESGNPVAEFSVSDLKEYEGMNINNINKILKNMEVANINKAYKIKGEKGAFEVFFLIDTFKYDGAGNIYVKFTQGAGQHFMDLKEPYTNSKIKKLFKIKSNSTYRIYELLLTKVFLFEKKHADVIQFEYELPELKMMLGLADFKHREDEIAQKKLGYTPSAKEIFEMFPKSEPYIKWSDFKVRVLDKAKEELDSMKGELEFATFDYLPIKSGRGGKVTSVKFILYSNNDVVAVNDEDFAEEQMIDELFPRVKELLSAENVTNKDIEELIKASEGEYSRIEKAYFLSKQTNSVIRNLVAWLKSAIKENYDFIVKQQGIPDDKAKEYYYNSHKIMNGSAYTEQKEKLDKYNPTIDDFRNAREKGVSILDYLENKPNNEINVDAYTIEELLFLIEEENNVYETLKSDFALEYNKDNPEEAAMIKKCVSVIHQKLFKQSIEPKTLLKLVKINDYNIENIIQEMIEQYENEN